MSILLVAGLDPTGQAGLARDVAVAAKMGVHPCPVATCTTVDDAIAWTTPPDQLRAALDAAHAAHRPTWMKVGVVASQEQAEVLGDFAKRTKVGIVHDPVLTSTSGHVFATPETLAPLRAATRLVTPNQEEADALGLQDGDRVHITKGGDLPGTHRGTGCRFATRVACLLSLGLDLQSAIDESHRDLEHELERDATEQAILADRIRSAHLQETRQGLHALLRVLHFQNIPEVGMNFAYALPGATDPRRDVCGLAGRITIAGFHRDWTGRVAFGGPHHTSRIATVLQEYDDAARCVLNHRFDDMFITNARAAGLTDREFRREDEPPDAPSSMEWGFRDAIRRHGGVPDLVWDRGGDNKEAMIRVIGQDPSDVARKVELMGAPDLADPDGRPRYLHPAIHLPSVRPQHQ